MDEKEFETTEEEITGEYTGEYEESADESVSRFTVVSQDGELDEDVARAIAAALEEMTDATGGDAAGAVSDAAISKARTGKRRRPNLIAIAVIVAIVLMFAASVRNIVSLQLEHARLQKEHEELIAKRDRLKIELKHVNSKEYIEEQARRQLRLVNPDEILFIFQDDDE